MLTVLLNSVANLVCVLLGGGVEIHMFEIICDDSAEILQASLYFFNVPLPLVRPLSA